MSTNSKKSFHITVGIYASKNYKINGVLPEDLESHIEYNKTFRFGRALVVDGKVEYLGYYKTEEEVMEVYNSIPKQAFPVTPSEMYH